MAAKKKSTDLGSKGRSIASKYGKPAGKTYVNEGKTEAATRIKSSGGTGKGTTTKFADVYVDKKKRRFMPDSVKVTQEGKVNTVKGTKSPKPSFAKNNLQKRKAASKMR